MDSQAPTPIPKALTSLTVVAHLEYDINALPPPPSSAWTRFVCISDTHCRTFAVPPGDVLLHSGDLTNSGTLEDFRVTLEWIREQPHPLKIIIAGNHDLPLHEEWYAENYERWHSEPEESAASSIFPDVTEIIELLKGPGKRVSDGPNVSDSGLVYLEDQSYVFQTREGGRKWSVYGSPWQPDYCNWAFNYERDKTGEDIVKTLPKTDILLTHGPPLDILDVTLKGEPVGCEALRARIPELRPRLHLFGHIHEARGAEMYKWGAEGGMIREGEGVDDQVGTSGNGNGGMEKDGDGGQERTLFVNASAWPMGKGRRTKEFGGLGFQPVVVDLLDETGV